MRLIDADRLRAKITAMVTRPHQFMYEIERAPTVEAIPIEWIKNVWLKNPDNQGEIDFFPPATFEVVMNWLIEDWEKENGNN